MPHSYETRRAGDAAGLGNSSCLAADSPKIAPSLATAQAKIELIRDDLAATISPLQATLDYALAMYAAHDDCGLVYSLRRARAYWQAISGSARDLVAAEAERLSALRQEGGQ